MSPGYVTMTPPKIPGAMEIELRRTLPDGTLVEFNFAPAGWLTKKGEPRQKDWREYYLTPFTCECGSTDTLHRIGCPALKPKRVRVPSVTTLLSAIMPKDGLAPWYEYHGIIGGAYAYAAGLLNGRMEQDEIVRTVRKEGLGADAARDDAANRGINVHAILERFMQTGLAPNPAEHPEAHRPFIQGLTRWLLWADPEPLAVELLVADPERCYAGRVDLIAKINGRTRLVDLKTNPRGLIYDSAHVQTSLYLRAENDYGDLLFGDAILPPLLVAVDGSGGFREQESIATGDLITAALDFYPLVRDLCSRVDSANRVQKQAMEAIG